MLEVRCTLLVGLGRTSIVIFRTLLPSSYAFRNGSDSIAHIFPELALEKHRDSFIPVLNHVYA